MLQKRIQEAVLQRSSSLNSETCHTSKTELAGLCATAWLETALLMQMNVCVDGGHAVRPRQWCTAAEADDGRRPFAYSTQSSRLQPPHRGDLQVDRQVDRSTLPRAARSTDVCASCVCTHMRMRGKRRRLSFVVTTVAARVNSHHRVIGVKQPPLVMCMPGIRLW
jgi:hypothetical protein